MPKMTVRLHVLRVHVLRRLMQHVRLSVAVLDTISRRTLYLRV